MSLRDLAESQLACKQQAQAAENAARQAKHAEEAVRLCTDWFLSVLKTKPDTVTCTSTFDNYYGRHTCRVEAEAYLWFSWSDDVNEFKFRSSDPSLEVRPAVMVIEEQGLPKTERRVWRKVVTEYSYTGHGYATDLPSLALHLQAVDKVRAKRSQ